MMKTFIIKNSLLCDHRGKQQNDIQIENGKITRIAPRIDGENILDTSSCILLPACIDLNIRTKNDTQKGLQNLEKKAITGGVGTIALSTQAKSLELFKFFNTQSPVSFLPSIIPYIQGKIQEVSQLHNNGSVALSLDTSIPSEALICLYKYAKMLSLPCLCSFFSEGANIQSEMSYQMGLSGISEYIEKMDFSRLIPLIENIQIPTLFQALSNFSLFEDIQSYPLIQGEVSIHHLLLNEEKIQGYNTWAKLKPPLSTKQTQQKFLREIHKVDMFTSLHREFSQSSKEQTFEDADFGVDCLEFYFPLLFTELVKTHHLSLEELSAKTAFNQAQFLKLNQGEIEVGREASLILINPNESFELSHPLYGEKKLFGKIKAFISPRFGFQKV